MNHHINLFQLQNERSTARKLSVMVLCNHCSPCREVMKSCKLLQPIAVGWLYQFRTGNEERNRLLHYSLPTLGFFIICWFWYSSLMFSNCSCDFEETCYPPRINVVYDMSGVYANLICVSCKYDFASNFRWNVAKVIA